jgi:hypothetical protein
VIVISAAGVAFAILLLVAAMITSNLLLVYISIGVSVAAALMLAAGVFMRRELFVRGTLAGTGAASDGPAQREAAQREAAQREAAQREAAQREAAQREAAQREAAQREAAQREAAQREAAQGDATHSRAAEEVTVNEALEEGLAARTTCPPGSGGSGSVERGASATFIAAVAESDELAESAASARQDSAARQDGPAGQHMPAEAEPTELDTANTGDCASVWVVRGVPRHHLQTCVLIEAVNGSDVDTMALAEAEAADCTPCRACHID